jgi:glycosyltransferase involved in cell wall biosynthesis
VIVVDQNDDGRALPLLERWSRHLSLQRVECEAGLSRARNAGLREATGDVVTFADDDCWYPVDLLQDVGHALTSNPRWDGVTGRVVDQDGAPSAARWSRYAGDIARANVWTRGTSISMFLRRRVVDAVGDFDETLGLGSGTPWGSGEETDYLLRAIAAGFVIRYEPSLTVFHPPTRTEFTPETIASGTRYGAGMGRVIRKHRYPWWFAGYHVGRAVGGAALAIARARIAEARFHLGVARGRARGWLAKES